MCFFGKLVFFTLVGILQSYYTVAAYRDGTFWPVLPLSQGKKHLEVPDTHRKLHAYLLDWEATGNPEPPFRYRVLPGPGIQLDCHTTAQELRAFQVNDPSKVCDSAI